MAVKKKKKKVEPVEVVEQVLTKEIVDGLLQEVYDSGSEPNTIQPSPNEPTIKVRPVQTFKDGGLLEYFAKLGFGVEWNKKEIREIPEWLYRLCISSGGKFEEIP